MIAANCVSSIETMWSWQTFIQKNYIARRMITDSLPSTPHPHPFSDITNTCVLPLLLCKQEKNGLIRLQLLISQHTQTHTHTPAHSRRAQARVHRSSGRHSPCRRPHQLAHTHYHIFHVSIFIQSYCNGTEGTAAGSPLWARLLPEVSA